MSKIGYDIINIDSKGLMENAFFSSTISIFKCTRGSAVVIKNGKRSDFKRNSHIFLFETVSLDFNSWSDDFEAVHCKITPSLASDLDPYLSNKVWEILYYSIPDIYKSSELEMLNDIFGQLLIIDKVDTMQMKEQLALHTMINYILILYNILLLHVDSEEINDDVLSSHTSSIIDRFFYLCNQFHLKERNIQFYANKLHVSHRHLYNITQASIKQTPKQVIDGYVIGTIKKLLLTTSLNIQQIAETLEFADQSTLRQFFVRGVGISPREYRRINRG